MEFWHTPTRSCPSSKAGSGFATRAVEGKTLRKLFLGNFMFDAGISPTHRSYFSVTEATTFIDPIVLYDRHIWIMSIING